MSVVGDEKPNSSGVDLLVNKRVAIISGLFPTLINLTVIFLS